MFRRHAFRKYNRKFFATNGACRTNPRISATFEGRLYREHLQEQIELHSLRGVVIAPRLQRRVARPAPFRKNPQAVSFRLMR
jgi:hypothetical protein